MINKNFWDLLAEKQDSLTKSGTIIADYLTKHAEEAQFLSISSLAKACNMAEATIYRFCKQLGFEGYNEMKISLAQANVTPTPFSSYSLDPSMPTSSLCDNVCASFQAAISNTMSVLDFDAIDEAALLLQRATSVYCLGQGGSRVLANDIWVRFATISNKFRNCGDSHTQLIAASLMGPGDVILFVSYSGSTHDMMDTLSVAKKTGAKIILKALEAPLFQIAANAGLEGAVIVNKVRESEVGTGFDAYNEEYVDMVKAGILDPAKVTRSALQNATSVASTLLTTESVVGNIKEETPAMPAGGGMGGMM